MINSRPDKKNIPRSLLNLLGLLSAFGIALGGMWVVQSLLSREKAALLQSQGALALPPQADDTDAVSFYVAEVLTIALEEDELVSVVRQLRSGGVPCPHEPMPGQLTMSQAIDRGREWTESFLLPRLGFSEASSQEYRADCYLWSFQEPPDSGSGEPLLSCWTVTLTGQGTETTLIMNAVTGQILDASFRCSLPLADQDRQSLTSLLCDYADSFHLSEPDSSGTAGAEPGADEGQPLCREIGTQGLQALLKSDSLAIGMTDGDAYDYTEIFMLHIYLNCTPA